MSERQPIVDKTEISDLAKGAPMPKPVKDGVQYLSAKIEPKQKYFHPVDTYDWMGSL